ncbi:MAG: HNH endonuclease [Acidimicrobiales bacterium]
MCDVVLRVGAGGLHLWSMPALRTGLDEIQLCRAQLDAAEALLLAAVVRQGGVPEVMFGSKMSPRDAQRRTNTAIALGDGSLPGAAEALASGEATFDHVAVLADLKDRLPEGSVAELLPRAKDLSPDKFRRVVQRHALPVAAVGEGSTGLTNSGGRWFRFDFDGYEGTVALNGIEAVMDRQWRAAHPERADEKLERPLYGQRLAAALLELCRNALAGQPVDRNALPNDAAGADGAADGDAGDGDVGPAAPVPVRAPQRAEPEIMIVVGYDKLFGDAQAAGICTTIDGVPLPVETVRKLLVDAKIYPVVFGGDGEVLDFGRARRFFTSAQKKAAAVRDLCCQFGDCDAPIRYADYHHCIPWADGGPTDVANEAPTCNSCHDKLTNGGYRLERRTGTTYTYDPDGQLIHQRTNRWKK